MAWAADTCEICGERFGAVIYLAVDQVTGVQRQVCENCTHRSTVCYVCGLPVARSLTTLPDGRVLCARDSQSVLSDESEAEQLTREVKDALDRQFAGVTVFPDRNVTVRMMDRQALQELLKLAGNDTSCPMVLGCTTHDVTAGVSTHSISLLSALPRPLFKATCVHEYAHVWINETVPAARRKRMDQDAVEGFCELVSHLFMNAQGATTSTALIRSNTYTHGQTQLFLDAEVRFGFNEVVEWMRHGEDARLMENDPDCLRRVELPQRAASITTAAPVFFIPPPPPAPVTLELKAIIWSPARPLALINGRSFVVQEQARVRLGATNVTLHCLAIGTNSARVRVLETNEEKELILNSN